MDTQACIDDETLALLVAGRLGEAARAPFVAHIECCDACRSVVTDAIALADETRTIAGRYRLEGELGRGGMGMVFRAHDDVLDRTVAIKLLPGRASASDPSRALALRESRAMARVHHRNVVAVHDAGHDGDEFYVAMEHVAGTTLRQWTSAQPRTVPQIVRMYVEACRGLAAAHAVGVVHRDFKPDNVLVDDEGNPRVADFGLARWLDDHDNDRHGDGDGVASSGVTVGGRVAGTPAYMPPEQARGQDVDRRADVFAVCVALWEACYGVRPFVDAPLDARLDAIARGERRGTSSRVGTRLRRVIERGLGDSRDDRHASIEALVDALERELQRPSRRRRLAAAVGAFGIVVASAFVLRDTTAPCRAPVDRLTAAMQPSALAQLQQTVFAGLDQVQAQLVWTSLRTEIHGAVAALDQEHVAACEAAATGDLSSDQAARLASCLRIERVALAHRLELGSDGDLDGVMGSATSDAPTWCRDLAETWAGPDALDADAATLGAEALLAEAFALARAGRLDAAAVRAAAAADAAAAAGQPALAVRARYHQGAFDPERPDADATLRAAARDAESLGEHSTAALAWLFAGYSASTDDGREHLVRAREQQARVDNAAVREHIEVRVAVLDGEIHIASGDTDAGCTAFEHALEVARAHAPTLVGDVLMLSSMSAWYRGDVRLAIDRLREVVLLLETRTSNRRMRQRALWNLAGAAIEADDLDTARTATEQSLALARDGDEARGANLVRLTHAEVLLRRGDLAAAEAMLALVTETGGASQWQHDDHAELAALRALAALLRDDPTTAADLARGGVGPDVMSIDLGMDRADALVVLGEALRRAGRATEALTVLEAALPDLRRAHPRSPETARVGVALGWVLHDLGRDDEALVRFDDALATGLGGPSGAWAEIGRIAARRARVLADDAREPARDPALDPGLEAAALDRAEATLRRYPAAHTHALAIVAGLR